MAESGPPGRPAFLRDEQDIRRAGRLSKFGLDRPLYHGTQSKEDAAKLLKKGANPKHCLDPKYPGQLGRGFYATDDRKVAQAYAGEKGYVLKVNHPGRKELKGEHFASLREYGNPQKIEKHHEKSNAQFKASYHHFPNYKSSQVCFHPDESKKLRFEVDSQMSKARTKSLLERVDAASSSRSRSSTSYCSARSSSSSKPKK